MSAKLIDTHAHLDMAPFNIDRGEVIRRAREAGVSKIITIGIDMESNRKAIELAEAYPDIWATVGFHPHEADRLTNKDIDAMPEMAKHARVVAIGEIGLDFYRDRSPRDRQIQAVKELLDLAVRVDLPAIIHCRQAEKEMLPVLLDWISSDKRPDSHPRGVIHCFNGELETARQYLDMEFFVSFGAYIGYPKSLHLRNVIKEIPQDRVVLETDCPFLPPQSHRGKRNEPAYILTTAGVLAEIWGISIEAVISKTTQNANLLFRLAEPA